MEKIELRHRSTKAGKNVYYVEIDGKVMYESAPTNRTYVAMLLSEHYRPVSRWGRLNLIGTGDFKYQFEAHCFPYLATVKEISDLVDIPTKTPITMWTSSTPYGHVSAYAHTEQDAIEKMAASLSRRRLCVRPSKHVAMAAIRKTIKAWKRIGE